MSAITAPAKVLVSGANGFIAIWVVKALLNHGYSVRGAIRSESKGTHLRNFFKDEVASGRLELVIVPEMMAHGAFDEAVKGVDAIEHTASPVGLDVMIQMIGPAVKGTLGILESAVNHAGPQLKRVTNPGPPPEEMISPPPSEARVIPPTASKSLAERAAWDFVTKHSSTITWDLITLCPPYVFGPAIHEVSTPKALNASVSQFYNVLFTMNNVLKDVEFSWVDVRDVAHAHILALEVPEAGGQRFIIISGPRIWQDWVDTATSLKSEIPDLSVAPWIPGTERESQSKVIF